jgi:hypothetical protein
VWEARCVVNVVFFSILLHRLCNRCIGNALFWVMFLIISHSECRAWLKWEGIAYDGCKRYKMPVYAVSDGWK